MSTLFDIIVLAFVLFFAYQGWEAGMWTAGVAALEVMACLTLAILLHEPVASFLAPWFGVVSSDISQTWAILIAFGCLAWIPFAVIRYRLHKTELVNLEQVDVDPLSDRIGGVIAGGIGGAMFVGGVLITMSMTPFAPLKPSGDRMQLDVGKLVLMSAGHFITERPEGYEGPPLPIQGGPASTKKDIRAVLTVEPWLDVDGDGAFDENIDRYRDVDGDGTFTKDLYAADVERNGQRRVGLVDKYVVGCWDMELQAPTRKRTDVKPEDLNPKKGKKGVDGPPTEEKPVETDF